jgi:hypothetical protein
MMANRNARVAMDDPLAKNGRDPRGAQASIR